MQDNDQNVAAKGHAPDIARRKAILRGLGKTAVIAGAATPLSSLAVQQLRYVQDGKNRICSCSGMMSVMHSGAVADVEICEGFKPDYYKHDGNGWNGTNVKANKWPTWPAVNGKVSFVGAGGLSYTPAALFSQVFGSGSNSKVGMLINDSGNEKHWIAALLNAQNPALADRFPHTVAEVIAQHNDPAVHAAALELYTTWVHTRAS